MNGRKCGATLLALALTIAMSGCGKQQAVAKTEHTSISHPSQTNDFTEATLNGATPENSSQPQGAPNKPYLSTAYPGLKGDQFATDSEMKALLSQAEAYFNAKPLAEILAKGGNSAPSEGAITFTSRSIASAYRTSKPNAPVEVPIIGLALGQGMNVLNAHALLWYENGNWHSQPYPQAPDGVRQKRQDVLKGNIGYGSFFELHQQGNRLAVVYNYYGTRMAEEVHLLQRENGVWEILWAPTYESWLEVINTRIEFHDGINSFTAHREDEKNQRQWTEEWKLQGNNYLMVSTTK